MPEENNTFGSVIIYQSWYETALKLGPEKQQKAIMQILNYGFYGTIPNNSDDLALELLFESWRPLVDAAQRHRKGGAPKGNQNAAGHKGAGGRPKKKTVEKTTTETSTKLQLFNNNNNWNVNDNYNNGHLTALLSEGAANDLEENERDEEIMWEDPQVAFEKWKKEHESI